MRWRLRSVRALVGALASLAVALAGSLPSAAPCAAAGAFDSSIVVNGNRRVEADTIRSYFRLLPGEQVDAAKIDAALKALYATELFQDVRITRSDGHVVVTVVEAGVIDRVAFEGNSRVKDEQLTSEVQSKPRGTFSRAKVQADVQRIIEVYHRAGRYDVRVEPKIIDRSDSRVDLVFQISEGGRTTVRRIDFTGNHAFSATRLKGEIKTTETNLLSFLKNSDVYDADRIEADRDLLRRFYLNRGYADARIVSAAAAFDPALKGFVVTFTVDEGELYRFGAIDLQSSVREVDPATLRGRLKTVSGRVFDASAVEKSADEMTIEMSRRGYPFAQVRPHADRDPSTHTVNLRYLVDQATRAYVERINIRGNTRTREYVIRREFDIAEGDPYNKVLIDRAERRLKNLNFFKTVKIANEPGSAPDRIVINVDVDEQQTGDLSISGGYSTMDGLIAEVSVSERNLFGRGEYAKASFILGQYTKGFDVGFVEPFFLGTRASLGLDVFAKQTSVNSYQSFGSETYGATVKLGTPLDTLAQTVHAFPTMARGFGGLFAAAALKCR